MTFKQQKIISAILVAIVAFGGLEILVYIINLNQPAIFIKAAFFIWLFLALKITLLYDLHFKTPGALTRAKAKHGNLPRRLHRLLKITREAFSDRVSHLLTRHHWLQFQNYLILPGLLFWATVALLYLEMGNQQSQQLFVALSGSGLVLIYWYLKEIFSRKTEKVDRDIFAALGAVKIYATAITYGSAMAILRHFCLQAELFAAGVFSVSFLLMHQALFQHQIARLENLLRVLLISLALGGIGYFVYRYWGYNFYTAAIFMTAVYNLLWGTFHYHLDQVLNRRRFLETLLICAIVALMVFSVTNFKARLLNGCVF